MGSLFSPLRLRSNPPRISHSGSLVGETGCIPNSTNRNPSQMPQCPRLASLLDRLARTPSRPPAPVCALLTTLPAPRPRDLSASDPATTLCSRRPPRPAMTLTGLLVRLLRSLPRPPGGGSQTLPGHLMSPFTPAASHLGAVEKKPWKNSIEEETYHFKHGYSDPRKIATYFRDSSDTPFLNKMEPHHAVVRRLCDLPLLLSSQFVSQSSLRTPGTPP